RAGFAQLLRLGGGPVELDAQCLELGLHIAKILLEERRIVIGRVGAAAPITGGLPHNRRLVLRGGDGVPQRRSWGWAGQSGLLWRERVVENLRLPVGHWRKERQHRRGQ